MMNKRRRKLFEEDADRLIKLEYAIRWVNDAPPYHKRSLYFVPIGGGASVPEIIRREIIDVAGVLLEEFPEMAPGAMTVPTHDH